MWSRLVLGVGAGVACAGFVLWKQPTNVVTNVRQFDDRVWAQMDKVQDEGFNLDVTCGLLNAKLEQLIHEGCTKERLKEMEQLKRDVVTQKATYDTEFQKISHFADIPNGHFFLAYRTPRWKLSKRSTE